MDSKVKKAFDAINKHAKKDIAVVGSNKITVEGQSTGIELLDYAIGCGGYPKGRITEIFGLASSTKTSLCLFGIAQAQRDGKVCMFVDAEFALDFKHAIAMGVDVDNLIVLKPDSGEEVFDTIEQMLRDKLVDYIVVDSIPSLIPIPELEAEVNKPTMGGQARLVASGLRRLVPLVAKNDTVLIFINQLRKNIMGGTFDPYTKPGGMSLSFYISVSIRLANMGKLKKGDEILGQQIKFQMKKNKVGMNNHEGELKFLFADGFHSELNMVEVATKKGVLEREGNTYSFGEVKLGTGKEKANAALLENPQMLEQVKTQCQL